MTPKLPSWLRGSKRKKEEEPNREIYRDRENPPHLPAQRPRRLTLPLSGTGTSTEFSETSQQWTSDQQHSKLMKCPPKIRVLIYEELFGNRKIHFCMVYWQTFLKGSKWRSKAKLEPGPDEWQWMRCITSSIDQHGFPWDYDMCIDLREHPERKIEPIGALPLLLTCRKM
jgi:hypothetical protein